MKKMKKWIRNLILFVGVVIILLCALVTRSAIVYKPLDIPFTYDPNQVQNKLIGGIQGRAGTLFTYDVTAHDPDGDDYIVNIVNPEGDMAITEIGDILNTIKQRWDLTWTPTIPGLYYIDIEGLDIPLPENGPPKSSRATIVINVLIGNRAPEFDVHL